MNATTSELATREGQVALPLGRKVPRGRLRWYLAACPVGREEATCRLVKKAVSNELLQDAFVPRREWMKKFHGTWVVQKRDLFTGYFIVVTDDAKELSSAFSKLSFPVYMSGAVGRGFAPIDKDVQAFLELCMDEDHIIRKSEAEIVSDELHVLWGPLKGHESRVLSYNRSHLFARVRMGSGRGSDDFTLAFPLAIPVRR